MSKYSGRKRVASSRAIRERFAETQKKFIRGVLFLIAITLLIVFVFGDHGLFQLYKLKRERAEIQKYISQLREEREMLITEKNRLENDLEYIEKQSLLFDIYIILKTIPAVLLKKGAY